MVTGGTSRLGIHFELLLKLETKFLSGFHAGLWVIRKVSLGVVAKVVNFLQRTEVNLWSSVTVKTPSHRVRLSLVNDFHFIHVAVATLAGNPAVDVRGVVEIDVVRGFVNAHPLDRFAIVTRVSGVHRFVERSEFRTLALDVLVAIPTSVTGRNVRVARDINKRMAIPTIQPELIDVDFVRKRNRLRRLVADDQGFRRRIITES